MYGVLYPSYVYSYPGFLNLNKSVETSELIWYSSSWYYYFASSNSQAVNWIYWWFFQSSWISWAKMNWRKWWKIILKKLTFNIMLMEWNKRDSWNFFIDFVQDLSYSDISRLRKLNAILLMELTMNYSNMDKITPLWTTVAPSGIGNSPTSNIG